MGENQNIIIEHIAKPSDIPVETLENGSHNRGNTPEKKQPKLDPNKDYSNLIAKLLRSNIKIRTTALISITEQDKSGKSPMRIREAAIGHEQYELEIACGFLHDYGINSLKSGESTFPLSNITISQLCFAYTAWLNIHYFVKIY